MRLRSEDEYEIKDQNVSVRSLMFTSKSVQPLLMFSLSPPILVEMIGTPDRQI